MSFDGESFSGEELRVLKAVDRSFSGRNVGEIVRLSHEEPARAENQADRQLVDYQRYASSTELFPLYRSALEKMIMF